MTLPWLALDSMDVDRRDLPDALAYCDSTGDHLFRSATDIELSHWYPNRTPTAYRADTSTEIVLRFVADHQDHAYVGLGVHCDTDAALSLFALVEPALALEHASLLARVAEAGDFGFWLDHDGARLYAAVRAAWEPRPGDRNRDRIERSLDAVRAVLTGADSNGSSAARVQRESDALIGAGVDRVEVSDHLAAYVVGAAHADVHLAALAREPRFDQPVGELVWASHRVRNRLDAERFQLLSIPSDGGWVHTLWYPQYLPWDTETLWRAQGLAYTGSRLEWRYENPALDELAAPAWTRAELLAPWAPGFPVLAAAGIDSPPSPIAPETLMETLRDAW